VVSNFGANPFAVDVIIVFGPLVERKFEGIGALKDSPVV